MYIFFFSFFFWKCVMKERGEATEITQLREWRPAEDNVRVRVMVKWVRCEHERLGWCEIKSNWRNPDSGMSVDGFGGTPVMDGNHEWSLERWWRTNPSLESVWVERGREGEEEEEGRKTKVVKNRSFCVEAGKSVWRKVFPRFQIRSVEKGEGLVMLFGKKKELTM